MKRLLKIFFFALFALGLLGANTAPRSTAPIDPRVLEDTTDGRTGSFLVVLKQKVDLLRNSPAGGNPEQRVENAYHRLKEVAQASQVGLLRQLQTLAQEPAQVSNYRAFWLVNMVAVRGKRSAVEALARLPEVAAIESDRPFKVPLEQFQAGTSSATEIEWNIRLVNAPQIWAHGVTGQGIVYAVADTGVDWTHPALQPHYRGWNGASADHNYNWWDAIHSGPTSSYGLDSLVPFDDYGHGTHVAGTGVGDDGLGHQIGMAPGAKWIACRNMDMGVGKPSTYIECFQFFIAPTDLQGNHPNAALHADVISNSYSCPPTEGCVSGSLHEAVEQVQAAGIFMAVSAGNSGSACSSIADPPGIEAGVFTVGSTDLNMDIAGNSSRGPVTVDGSNRMKPDLSAPGVNVTSSLNGGGYGPMSGTSMAAPHVAGAVALLWSAYPQLRGQVVATESILRTSAVQRTTAQMCGTDTAYSWPNNVYGYGFLDVGAAFNSLPHTHTLALPLIIQENR